MKKMILLLILIVCCSAALAEVIEPVKWYVSQQGKDLFWKEDGRNTGDGLYKMADLGREVYISEIVLTGAEDENPEIRFMRDDFLFLVKKPGQWSGPVAGSLRDGKYVLNADHELARYVIIRSKKPVKQLEQGLKITAGTPEVVISSMNVTQKDEETAIGFSTNIAVQAQVSYEKEQVVLEKQTISNVSTSTEISKQHRFVLKDLVPGVTYWYVIITTDIYGNKHESPIYKFARQP